MKFMVLLALVGLASCRSADIGGHFGKDVKIQYTFEDKDGEEVKVEEEHDRLQVVRAPTFRDAAYVQAKTPERELAFLGDIDDEDVRFVPASAPVYKPIQRTRFVEAAPAPRTRVQTLAVPVPAPQPLVETRFVEAAPAPRTRVQTQYVEVEAVPVPAPQPLVETRFVGVEVAPLPLQRSRAEARLAEVAYPVPALQPQVETRYVEALPAPPTAKVETRFVEVEAPKFRSRKVDLDDDDDDFRPLLVESARPVAVAVSRASPAPQSQPLAAVRQSVAAIDRIPVRGVQRVSDSSDEN
ncbi:diacylglycerol kinase kappa-like [Penaeus japonicus]|uniref:diacylglycerol kinase kappa-like n=1 Tax=Penaeus japonicus TaxID=27405 RepID=UPI001C70EB6D|nr:diacylglycerol kinase kappa-like [Penaeus japonicus]